MNNFDPEADLVAANPVPEAPAAAMLPPDINEMVLRQITESSQGRSPLRGVNLARVGFLGALASVALVLLGVNFYAGSDIDTITPATGVVPIDVPETTAEVLTISPSTTVAAPPTSQQATTSTAPKAASISTTARPATSTTLGASASSLPEIVAPAPLPDPQGESVDDAEEEQQQEAEGEPCTASGLTQRKAVAAYSEACSAPRVDCDPVEDHWVCSSEQIGNASP